MRPFLDLNVKEPLLQAPMAGVQDHRLALAVCRAGGLGALPAAMLSPEQLQSELRQLHEEARGAPYNVNFFLPHPACADPEPGVLQAWHALLAPLRATAERQGVADFYPSGQGKIPKVAKPAAPLR